MFLTGTYDENTITNRLCPGYSSDEIEKNIPYSLTVLQINSYGLVIQDNRVSPIKYINNSRHLARKYARIFVRGHYLFREANSFPRA